ncbi:potassium channel family protein [Halobacterium noricense]|uniref:potassium channel family protein n=1 Tax=Halobacterium noricense TaxID=223182 RepID=UPI001E493211|nr:TrkA C-terminal domain-containing protein [Halobacterium noricense]UHH24836.1 TrkA C-terminal domain-containing protein [Halobacterium noricense]
MTSTPVQALHGIYLGLLAGVIPALVSFGFGFLFRYVTGLSVPAFGVVVLGVALAGVNGGFLAFADPTITQAANSTTLVVALLVVAMLTFYTHSVGDKMGASLPRRLSLKSLRERTLHTDAIEFVGGRNEVTVSVVGGVRDLEGYPPLPESLRASIHDAEWRFPADLPLSELETRFADRLRSDFDVEEASVTVDEHGRATVAAAPPAAGVSKRTPVGKRAVSVSALVPTGIARGDEVSVLAGEERVDGTVVSAKSGGKPAADPTTPAAEESAETEPAATPAPTTTGGEGRVTVAVQRPDAESLLAADRTRIVVRARGTRREYELLGLLRRGGQRVRRLTLRADTPVVDTTLGEANVRETYGVTVLAGRHDGSWTVAPTGDVALSAGDELFVAGPRRELDAFEEVAK